MARVVVLDAVQESDLLRLREPVRSYLGRTVSDEQELDDLVQETLLRVWEVRGRVGRAAAASYAVTTARNLVQSRDRARQLHARHAHRLHEPEAVDGPEVHALRQEERAAAARVASTLTEGDLALLGHDVAGADPQARTAQRRSRLARARAKARVDYLLHLRRLDLPTPRCRPVLEALSAGDRRQQLRTGAAQHLLTCPVCAGCAPALLGRERRLFGVVAVPLLIVLGPLWRALTRAPRATSAVTAAAVAAVVAGGILWPGPAPATGAAGQAALLPPVASAAPTPAPVPAGPAPPAGSAAAAAPAALLLDGGAGFAGAMPLAPGRPVIAKGVLVRRVPADEGFWVGPDDGSELFVRLAGDAESPQSVRTGDLVSFIGTVQQLAPGVAAGVEAREGLAQLTAQGGYLAVPMSALTIDRTR